MPAATEVEAAVALGADVTALAVVAAVVEAVATAALAVVAAVVEAVTAALDVAGAVVGAAATAELAPPAAVEFDAPVPQAARVTPAAAVKKPTKAVRRVNEDDQGAGDGKDTTHLFYWRVPGDVRNVRVGHDSEHLRDWDAKDVDTGARGVPACRD